MAILTDDAHKIRWASKPALESETQGRSHRATRLAWDKLNRLTTATDALGGQTAFTYDSNGNTLALTDALNHGIDPVSWTLSERRIRCPDGIHDTGEASVTYRLASDHG